MNTSMHSHVAALRQRRLVMKSAERPSKTGGHRSLLVCLFVGLGLLATRKAAATEYYVSPTGSDSNPGTKDSPWGTVQKAADTASAGDTVWFRGGTYAITTPHSSNGLEFTKSGTSDTNRIKYWAYPGEVPVIDFTKMKVSSSGYTMGFHVTGSYLHFKGLEENGVPMINDSNNGFAVDDPASNDIFELLNMHHNAGNGIFIGTKQNGGHVLLNCDAHDNYDPSPNGKSPGENADGFGVHYQTKGTSTIINGCRAWWNSDDGYDFISQEVPVTIKNSYAYGSGYINSGTGQAGNGNCFKIGSSKTGIRHLVQNNVAWGCKASGFYANHSGGGNTWYNNTAYKNGTQFNMLSSTWSGTTRTGDDVKLTGDKAHILRNNIAYPNKNNDIGDAFGTDSQFNTWDLNITPKDSDFVGVTEPTPGTGMLGPRQADGSPPNVDFLKLAAGSQMIDKGTDVGLPAVGKPDLGAYEYGATASSAGGGATGTGGTGSGGTIGTGGAGSGGSSGGSSGGGSIGIGGAIASGGATGRGGAAPAGGSASGSGGSSGTGGATVTVTGGTPSLGSGGTAASGGALPAGGTTNDTRPTGGSATASSGGEISRTGGASSATAETGGSTANGAGGAAGGQSGTTVGVGNTSSGCSCAVGTTSTRASAGYLVAILGVLGMVRHRRRRSARG
jgi:MYXO-CTERM domain-containing protein